jgi:DNA repair exonuclease SbcCD ATPase subunit
MFSYGERNVINFDKVTGLMGLFAPNAQGKSSLFDAISFCLFDKCSRAYKASAIMNNRKADFHCQLEFSVDGVTYGIRREGRTINKGKNVKVDVDFWREGDSGRESLNGTERRDTNQVIETYVGRYEDFIMTALSLQANNALFIDKSQSERKDLMAQFMGLDIFDKLYDTATNDIKDVNALIRNFRKTDFTTELAQKETDLNSKREEYDGLDAEKLELENRKSELDEQIVNLSQQIVPIQVNLKIDDLNERSEKLKGDIDANKTNMQNKTKDITTITETMVGLMQGIDETKQLNGIDIEVVYSNYQQQQKDLIEATKIYDIAKRNLSAAEEKISHLDKHEYDPNCKFCCNNVFVKDAMDAKDTLPELKEAVKDATINATGIQQTLDSWEGIEEQYLQFTDYKTKLEKGKAAHKKYVLEFDSFITKEELLQHQLETTKADIKRYNDNEETIINNQALDIQIQNVRREKKGVEIQISDVNKLMLRLMSEVGATKTYIDNMMAKMEEVKELETKNQLYTFYLDAVKKDGVPYELISKALPAIENEVNNILGQVVDFSISMDTDGKNINARIVYEDQEWALEMCSGMEKFISGLAIRVALINICNLPRPNFLVIDEGFGTLDADNLSSLFMMMQYLKTQFDFIWVISHLEQMRDIVDGLIEIKKIDGFSKINF